MSGNGSSGNGSGNGNGFTDSTNLDSSILLVFSVSGTFFLLSVVIYLCFRRKFASILIPRGNRRDKTTFISWIVPLFKSFKEEDFYKKGGINAVLYLTLQIYLIRYALLLTLISTVILIININYGDHTSVSGGFAITISTSFNANENTALLVASNVTFIISFSLIGYFIIYLYNCKATELRIKFRTEKHEAHSYTVKLKKLPKFIDNNHEKNLLALFDLFYPDSVVAIHIGYHLSKVNKLKEELRHALEELLKVDYVENNVSESSSSDNSKLANRRAVINNSTKTAKLFIYKDLDILKKLGNLIYQYLCCCCWPGGRLPSYYKLVPADSTFILSDASDDQRESILRNPEDVVDSDIILPNGSRITGARKYWQKKVTEIEHEIKVLLEQTPYTTTGTAFVTFNKVETCLRCQRDFHPKYIDVTIEHAIMNSKKKAKDDSSDDEDEDESTIIDRDSIVMERNKKIGREVRAHMDIEPAIEHYGVKTWRIKPAPVESDILWDNLKCDKGTQRFRKIFTFSLVIVLSFVVALPSSFAIPIVQFLFPEDDPTQHSFIIFFLPTLFVVLFQALLPVILELATSGERPHSTSELHHSVMREFYMYLLWNVIIFQLILSKSLETVGEIILGKQDLIKAIENINFVTQVGYYFSYLFQITLFGGSLLLLRFGDFVFSRFRRFFVAGTPYEKAEIDAISICPFRYYLHNCEMMMVTTIMLLFSVISPLIIPVAMLFFCVRHVIDRINIMKVTPKDVGDGRLSATVSYYFCAALFIFQAVMIVWFLIEKEWIGASALLPLPVVTIALAIYVTKRFHVLDQRVDLRDISKELKVINHNNNEKMLEEPILKTNDAESLVAIDTNSEGGLSNLFLKQAYIHPALAAPETEVPLRRQTTTELPDLL